MESRVAESLTKNGQVLSGVMGCLFMIIKRLKYCQKSPWQKSRGIHCANTRKEVSKFFFPGNEQALLPRLFLYFFSSGGGVRYLRH